MPNGAKLGKLKTLDNTLAFASCKIDLREQYSIHLTKLEFTVWNSFESSFTGAFACVDSVRSVPLGVNKHVVQGSNFDFSTLKSPDARFQVEGIGVEGNPCPRAKPAGLLGVIYSSTVIGRGGSSDALTGNTLHGAGIAAAPGFVRWDPADKPPHKPE